MSVSISAKKMKSSAKMNRMYEKPIDEFSGSRYGVPPIPPWSNPAGKNNVARQKATAVGKRFEEERAWEWGVGGLVKGAFRRGLGRWVAPRSGMGCAERERK